MNLWFIDQTAINQMAVSPFSAERIAEIRANADTWARPSYAAENLRIVGNTAKIDVKGVLLESATVIDDLYARYFGESYSTYPGIVAQLKAAEANPAVANIEFYFDTPGGIVAGLDDAAQILSKASKPTKAVVGWMCASAGYYLASQCKSIVASNRTSAVGSIGTLVSLVDATAYYEKMGVKFYTISSSNAPEKAPAPHSEEFKKSVQDRVDFLGGIFAERVAEGRTKAGKPITKEEVEQNFGRGGLVFAEAALAAGMIDAVEDKSNRKEDGMNEVEKAAVREEGVLAGIAKEKARVSSLLPFMAADSARVIKAIEGGEELSAGLFNDLHAAGVAKAEADAVARHEAAEQARIKAAAEARAQDAPPAVTGTEQKSEAETASEKAAAELKALAMKMS